MLLNAGDQTSKVRSNGGWIQMTVNKALLTYPLRKYTSDTAI